MCEGRDIDPPIDPPVEGDRPFSVGAGEGSDLAGSGA